MNRSPEARSAGPRAAAPSSPRAGFTLVEVMVTLAIMSLILIGLQTALHTAVYSHDDIAVEIAQVRDGPRILDLLERDLRSLHVYNIPRAHVLRGQLERHAGTRGDQIDFVTGTDSARRILDPESSRDEPRMVAADLAEVGYRLRLRPDHNDFLELYRRERLLVDEEPLQGGRYELLHNRVTEMRISYREVLGEDAEDFDEWDMEERGSLPAAVVVQLTLQADPDLVGDYADQEVEARQLLTYTRVIAIPPSYSLALAVRPARPVEIDPDAPAPGAGGGGPGEDGDPTGGPGLGGAGGAGIGDIITGGEGGMPPGEGSDFTAGGGRGFGPGGPGGGRGGAGEFLRNLKSGLDGSGAPPDFQIDPGDQEALEDLLEEYELLFGGGGR